MSVAAMSDSQAIALLCAPLSIGDEKSLTTVEWAHLASAIHRSELGHPGGLGGMSAEELEGALGVDLILAERLARLLERGGPLAFEFERLADRGIWVLTRADDEYPSRVKQRLGLRAPPVLFGSGSRDLLSSRAVAIVGSRDASAGAMDAARTIAEQLAHEIVSVVSGGARGVDRMAMTGVTSAGGVAVGFVADNLVRLAQQTETRELLVNDQLALVTPFAPESRFTVGNAMARNKLIYCAADAALVIATTAGSGGTWAGATEALKARWVPVWVWQGSSAPAANGSLVDAGAQPLRDTDLEIDSLFKSLTAPDAQGADVVDSRSDFPDLRSSEIRAFLAVPRSEGELRDEFDLKLGQVRTWMKECVASDQVIRRENPVRYVLCDAEPSLFDAH